jgi:hypothetical protein
VRSVSGISSITATGTAPTTSSPDMRPDNCAMPSRAAPSSRSTVSECACSTLPWAVGTTPCVVRTSSGAPTAFSSSRTALLRAGCDSPSGLAQAQEFPTKPVRIITPFPVGSGPEGVTRLVADKLSRMWGKPVTVENRPGGNGFIAIDAFKRGATDGHDLIQLDNVHLSAYPHLFKKLPYDTARTSTRCCRCSRPTSSSPPR